MTILTIAGSPSTRSRSSGLLRHAADRLSAREFIIDAVSLGDVQAEDLIGGNYGGQAAASLRARVGREEGP